MSTPSSTNEPTTDPDALREAVRARYAAAASAVTRPTPLRAGDALPVLDTACCGSRADAAGRCGRAATWFT